MKSTLLFIWGMCASTLLIAQISNYVHVDQFGYLTDGNKIAVLSDPQLGFNANESYTPGNTLELRNATTDEVIFSAVPQSWNNGATHEQSGDRGWWFDFSSVNAPGSYYVHDPANNASSAVFEINSNPYREVLQAAIRMFYYNRCNDAKAAPFATEPWTDGTNFLNPLQDANCRFIFDPGNATLEREMSGGWFDAGDYNKYVTFAHTPVHELLSTYEDHPELFGDDWNWPESGNGLSDLLDEVKWELDWLMKMANTDGSVHIKMGSQNFSENTSSPPSANTDPRFYGNTCTSASVAMASMLSHAALVFKDQTGMTAYADELESVAKSCWSYFLPRFESGNLETECDNGEIIAGDADMTVELQTEWGLIAAIYLFELTGESSYANYISSQYGEVEPLATGFWGPYKPSLNEALLAYTTLSNADTGIANAIQTSAKNAVDNNWNRFYAFSEEDLYRAESPDWIYNWGSNLPKAGIASLCMTMEKYNVSPSRNEGLREKAYEQVHYFHGVNPLGLVQLSNMYALGGDRCVNEIYHTWFADGTDFDHALNSSFGPAPGFLTGGPNHNFSVTTISPPANQPIQKSYLDFNDGWPESSWEISEPAIYYQAVYVRLLAHFVNISISSSGGSNVFTNRIRVYPNPTKNQVKVVGVNETLRLQLWDSQGRLFKTQVPTSGETSIDLGSLPGGIYWLSIIGKQNQRLFSQKIVKQE